MGIITVPSSVTVAHVEIPGSPTEQQDEQGRFTATRVLRCAWADRGTLARQIVGYNEASGSNVICHLPQVYPNDSEANVRARRFSIAPMFENELGIGASPSSVGVYTHAKVTIEYDYADDSGTEGGDSEGGGIIKTESILPESEVYTMPPENMRWKTSGKAIEPSQAPAKHQPLVTYVVTLSRLPQLIDGMIDYAGYINSASVYSRTLKKTFAANTLLYQPGSFTRNWSLAGSESWQVEMRFVVKYQTWLKFWNVATSAWDTIQVWNGSSWSDAALYPSVDLNGILLRL